MSSDDHNKNDNSPKSQRLVLGGDSPQMANADRVSTVLVSDPVKQQIGGGYGPNAEPTHPFIDAEEPTPPPVGAGSFLDAEAPTPPPAAGDFLDAEEPTPPPISVPSGPTPSRPTAKAVHDAEHITSTGFIPSETFKMPAEEGKKKKSKRGTRKFSLPSFRWLDDGELQQRLAYGGGGMLAGALVGGIMGVLNAFLQGWSVAQGSAQIIGLAILVGLVFAIMAAMKPSRVDHVMERLGLGED